MLLFSPKFDWSISHLSRFNWSYWALPKCSCCTQMCLILPKTLSKLFSWPKFDEGCWNYYMIPVHSRAVSILLSRAKKNGSDYFAVLAIFYGWFGYYFPSVWKVDTNSLHVNVAVYFAQMLKIFARIMANFSALGMWPHPLHPHAVCLWLSGILIEKCSF